MSEELMPASQARALIDEGKAEKQRQDRNYATKAITEAIRKGESNASLSSIGDTHNLKKWLQELGYEVSLSFDKNEELFLVSW